MCYDASLANVLQSLFFDQSTKSMKGTTCFECADSLLVLAFEEQPYFRRRSISRDVPCIILVCRYLGPNAWISVSLRCGSDVIDRLACHHRCTVNIWLDTFMRDLDGLSSQWRAFCYIGHSC